MLVLCFACERWKSRLWASARGRARGLHEVPRQPFNPFRATFRKTGIGRAASSPAGLPHPKQQPLAAPVRPPGPHGSSACCRSRSRRAHDLREVIFTRARGQHVFLGVKYVDSHRPVDRPPRLCSTRRPSGRVDLATFGRQRSMLVTRSGCPWTLGRQGQQEPTCRAGGAREDECHEEPLVAAATGP